MEYKKSKSKKSWKNNEKSCKSRGAVKTGKIRMKNGQKNGEKPPVKHLNNLMTTVSNHII